MPWGLGFGVLEEEPSWHLVHEARNQGKLLPWWSQPSCDKCPRTPLHYWGLNMSSCPPNPYETLCF